MNTKEQKAVLDVIWGLSKHIQIPGLKEVLYDTYGSGPVGVRGYFEYENGTAVDFEILLALRRGKAHWLTRSFRINNLVATLSYGKMTHTYVWNELSEEWIKT